MKRLAAVLIVMSFLDVPILTVPILSAQASSDPGLLRQQESLLAKRADVQRRIQNAQRNLRQVETDRKDKLEELAELCSARADLNSRHAFSKDIDDEIAVQTRNLHGIEGQRSDCLEELDGLYQGLGDINRDIADCDRRLN